LGIREESNMFNSVNQKTLKMRKGEREEQRVFKSTRKSPNEIAGILTNTS
jgi:hypothetical protein